MTKEEAKLVLDNARPQTKEIDRQFYDDEDLNNALDMAIKSLEQQPSEDCVSRQAMLDAITEIDDNTNMDIYTNEVREIIRELPPVTPTQRWIPVSERLPEEETDVLICNANKEIAISRGSYSTEIKNAFIWYTCGWRFGEVLAWQPLPKPYEEKRGRE